MKYVYKIVAAIGALATIPMLIFSKIFHYSISSTALQILGYLAQMGGSSAMKDILEQTGGKTPTGIADVLSIYDIFDLASAMPSGDGSLTEKLGGFITPLTLFGVVMALVAICAIVTAIFAFAAKNNRKVIYSSIVGIGLSFMLTCIFEDIADPVLDGTLSIATLLNSVWGGFLGEIDAFALTSSFWFIPITFGAVILWTLLYNYTLPEKEKKERKLMLGEADDE